MGKPLPAAQPTSLSVLAELAPEGVKAVARELQKKKILPTLAAEPLAMTHNDNRQQQQQRSTTITVNNNNGGQQQWLITMTNNDDDNDNNQRT